MLATRKSGGFYYSVVGLLVVVLGGFEMIVRELVDYAHMFVEETLELLEFNMAASQNRVSNYNTSRQVTSGRYSPITPRATPKLSSPSPSAASRPATSPSSRMVGSNAAVRKSGEFGY